MNPWQVGSIEDFHFYNCPECKFRSKGSHDFKEHALGNHPCSIELFYPSQETHSTLNIKEEKEDIVGVEVDLETKFEPELSIITDPPDDSEGKLEPEEIDEVQDFQEFQGHDDSFTEDSDSDQDYVPEKRVKKKHSSDIEEDPLEESQP